MRAFDHHWTIENIAGWLKQQAAMGVFNGGAGPRDQAYCHACTVAHQSSGSIAILTRDTGHHSSGWWKNPDYERCVHLSLSFRESGTGVIRPKDKELTQQWIEAVFGATKNLIWAEPPYYPEGKRNDTWHYRVFYAPEWAAPILPRGEVYSKRWTPAHWLSYSDLMAAAEKETHAH